jgi:single-strand DNA-binding protein
VILYCENCAQVKKLWLSWLLWLFQSKTKEQMKMLNKIILMGRLTKDPELRYTTKNNIPVANFSLAVDRNYSKGEEKETDFFDIIAWKKKAEFVSQYFAKGQQVCVEGRLQRRKYEDTEGNSRYAFEVIADSVYFAGYNKPGEDVSIAHDFDPFEDVA